MVYLGIALCLVLWFVCGEVAFIFDQVAFILAKKEPSRLLYKYHLIYLFGGLFSLITVVCSMIIEGVSK